MQQSDRVPKINRSLSNSWQSFTALARIVLAGTLVVSCERVEGDVSVRGEPRNEANAVILAGVALARDPDRAGEWATEVSYATTDFEGVFLEEIGTVFARLDQNGTLTVSAGPEILRIGPEIGQVRRVAREGDGPGEFQGVSGLGLNQDGSLFATDHFNGRFTEFGPGGEVRRTLPRVPPYSDGIEVTVLSSLPDGKMLGVPSQWRPARAGRSYEGVPDGAFVRDPVPLLVLDSLGTIVDSLGRWAGLERVNGMVVPFARSVMYHSRGAWTVIGESDSLDLSLYHHDELTLRIHGPGTVAGPSDQLRRQWDSAVVQSLPRFGTAVVSRMAEIAGPPTLPAFAGVLLDDEQNLWIGEYLPMPSGGRQWWIVSRDGKLLGTVILPALGEILLPSRTELLDVAGGRLALLRQGDTGELHVEVHKIKRN